MTPELWARYLQPSRAEQMCSRAQQGVVEPLAPLVAAYRPVLCVGCGDGTELAYFPGSTGVTLNAGNLLPACRQRHNVVLADMHCLPFRDGSFSAIFCKDTFEHALAPWIVLQEFTRVARDCILLACPDEAWSLSALHPMIPTTHQVAVMSHKLGWAFQHRVLHVEDVATHNLWDMRVFTLTRRSS